VARVAERGGAGAVGADEVAGEGDVGVGAVDADAIPAVAGDEVPLDLAIVGAAEPQPVRPVAQVGRARGVGADEVIADIGTGADGVFVPEQVDAGAGPA